MKGGRGGGGEKGREGKGREREREKKINHHIKVHHDKLTDLPGGYNLSLCSIELLQDREGKNQKQVNNNYTHTCT